MEEEGLPKHSIDGSMPTSLDIRQMVGIGTGPPPRPADLDVARHDPVNWSAELDPKQALAPEELRYGVQAILSKIVKRRAEEAIPAVLDRVEAMPEPLRTVTAVCLLADISEETFASMHQVPLSLVNTLCRIGLHCLEDVVSFAPSDSDIPWNEEYDDGFGLYEYESDYPS